MGDEILLDDGRGLLESGLLDRRFKRVFSERHAAVYGVSLAVFMQQVFYWWKVAKGMRKHTVYEGKVYFYKTTQQWLQEFPSLSSRTIKRHIAELELLNIIKRRYGLPGAHHKATWITFNVEALARDFNKKWMVILPTLRIQDENEEFMPISSATIPYDFSFSGSTFAQLSESYGDKLALLGCHGDTIKPIHSLFIIYKDYIKELLLNSIVQNSTLQEHQVEPSGHMSFDAYWTFYHRLLFNASKKEKRAAMKKIEKMPAQDRRNIMALTIDYWFDKELDRQKNKQKPHDVRQYVCYLSNFLTRGMYSEYEVEDFYERYKRLLDKQNTGDVHTKFKRLKAAAGFDPTAQ
jgi:hypothetical protein